MKKFLKGALSALFILLLIFGTIAIHTIVQAQSYGRLINYVGIVRGASQRLVKLEIDNQPNDELIVYLDDILRELGGEQGEYDLPYPKDNEYQKNEQELSAMWEQLKQEIYNYREGDGDQEELVRLSEAHFELANTTVFSADDYSARQTRKLLITCGVMLSTMLLTWIFIFWAGSKKLLLLEHSNEELHDLTRRDPLTGAYHVKAFMEKAQNLLDTYPKTKYAVVYTDFVDFQYINEVFGYSYGDGILAKYGDILREGLREGELCGRVSADNFVLLLRYEDKNEIVDRQRRADGKITAFTQSCQQNQSLYTYCGICCVEDVIENLKIKDILDRANFVRKTVKNGTNRNYVYYDEKIRQRLWEEKALEGHMLEALTNREFQVYYQPKVELKTGEIACSEALIRWVGEDGKVIPPDRFIPVFEQKFMINRLDRYVFEEVCRWLRHLIDTGKKALPVSVNVSRLQFYDHEFVTRYVEIRDKYRIPPNLLEIEFTESIVIDNANLLQEVVKQLKKAGFSCTIDDFGKGYSSLSLLKTLPVDVLKLDKFFFDGGEDKKRDQAVVQGIIDMVSKFDIRTVAEGVEDPEQVEFLKQAGCDYVQGYVFYRPMPEKDFEAILP